MPRFKLSKRSLKRLKNVHPDLVKVVKRAIQLTEVDFTVLEGSRTLARQKKLFEAGASKTMNSRHLRDATGYCYAGDLGAYVGRRIAWDWPLYYKIAAAMKDAAKDLDVDLEWGGDWRSFKDGPHFQLAWRSYPKQETLTA